MSLVARFLDPKNDFAFKQVFGREKHKGILMHFLNDILKLKGKHAVKDVQFLTPIQDPEIAAKKQSVVDVLCQDKGGRQFIIEMQVARTTGFKERAVYYASKAYVSQMIKGGQYEHLSEVIFIAIIDYELFPHKANYRSTHRLCDQETLEGVEKGREEGRKEGRIDERYIIARNLLQAGVAVSVITQSTGLTEAKIEALRDTR